MAVLDTFRLDGKVALVTGGSRGLGLQIAEALGEAGAAVAITARREPGLREAVAHLTDKGLTAISATCDISHNDQVESAVNTVVQNLGHIDILVNNAGATWGASFEELPFDAWDKVVRTNVDGTYFVSRAVGLHMIERNAGGRIINIASVAGLARQRSTPDADVALQHQQGRCCQLHACAGSHAGQAQHHRQLHLPGLLSDEDVRRPSSSQHGEEIADATPLRRLGNEHDLQGIAVLFASEASAFITGQVIAVDGGATAI